MKHLVFFVHGLTGDESTFGEFPKLLREDPDLESHITVFSWAYPTRFFSLPFFKTSTTVADLADGLRTKLKHRKETSIILVCHSLGGLIARRMLVDDIKKNITNKIRHTFFYATPHLGSGIADIGRRISLWQPQLKDLGINSSFLDSINEDWNTFEVNKKSNFTYVGAGLDNVVERNSARGFYGNDHFESVADAGHIDIAKPVNRDDLRYEIVKKILVELIQERLPTNQANPISSVSFLSEVTTPIASLTTSEAFTYLESGDPLKAKSAIDFFSGKIEHKDELFDKGSDNGNPIILSALRVIVSSYPEASAQTILERIRACDEYGGTVLHRARQAARLSSPALTQFLEGGLNEMLDGNLGQRIYTLEALGELEVGSLYGRQIRETVESYPKRLLSGGMNAAKRSFVNATNEIRREMSANLLNELINNYEEEAARVLREWGKYYEFDIKHVDQIIKIFLEPGEPLQNSIGLTFMEGIKASRSAPAMLAVLLDANDEELKCKAATHIWRQHNLSVIEEMRRRVPESIALNGVAAGLEAINDLADFDRLLSVALKDYPKSCLALRAIGIRKFTQYTQLLNQQLTSTDPENRGCAALALARIGGHERELRMAFQESSKEDEKLFMMLALIHAKLVSYDEFEERIRSSLARNSYCLFWELQADILGVLTECDSQKAKALAKAWAPFYSNRARQVLSPT